MTPPLGTTFVLVCAHCGARDTVVAAHVREVRKVIKEPCEHCGAGGVDFFEVK